MPHALAAATRATSASRSFMKNKSLFHPLLRLLQQCRCGSCSPCSREWRRRRASSPTYRSLTCRARSSRARARFLPRFGLDLQMSDLVHHTPRPLEHILHLLWRGADNKVHQAELRLPCVWLLSAGLCQHCRIVQPGLGLHNPVRRSIECEHAVHRYHNRFHV